mmetsp:Transcript_34100/g.30867  ORF Transcript_34100/g.30867 Transcript_34100/m.30867 type:complete len:240 (+) Transcript_34100:629-1348(+)
MKVWIGAAAHLANNALVWAQLYIDGVCHGIHGFIVPIRSKQDHTLLSGVIIGDMGSKVGLHAIDNGFMIFKNVRVPYNNMLDKFSQIDSQGKFNTTISNPDKRFAFALGALTGGRIALTISATDAAISALCIATRFAHVRRQFGLPNQPETAIIEYPLVQHRLFPYFAQMIGIQMAAQDLQTLWNDKENQEKLFDEKNPLLAEIHAVSSILKPYSAWQSQKAIQECRELCGGLGYSAYN